MSETLAFGTHPHHHLERAGNVHKQRKAARVRQVFEALDEDWADPIKLSYILKEYEGLSITPTTIKDYIRKNDFAKLNLDIDIDGWKSRRSHPPLRHAPAILLRNVPCPRKGTIGRRSP